MSDTLFCECSAVSKLGRVHSQTDGEGNTHRDTHEVLLGLIVMLIAQAVGDTLIGEDRLKVMPGAEWYQMCLMLFHSLCSRHYEPSTPQQPPVYSTHFNQLA